jgi:hypothetical protein
VGAVIAFFRAVDLGQIGLLAATMGGAAASDRFSTNAETANRYLRRGLMSPRAHIARHNAAMRTADQAEEFLNINGS